MSSLGLGFRALRRLDSLWDDRAVRQCRSSVARSLLRECSAPLLRAGYGGWLLYTAASAVGPAFIAELLDRGPLLVFGSGEYGFTDIFYAARGGDLEMMRRLLDGERGGGADGDMLLGGMLRDLRCCMLPPGEASLRNILVGGYATRKVIWKIDQRDILDLMQVFEGDEKVGKFFLEITDLEFRRLWVYRKLGRDPPF